MFFDWTRWNRREATLELWLLFRFPIYFQFVILSIKGGRCFDLCFWFRLSSQWERKAIMFSCNVMKYSTNLREDFELRKFSIQFSFRWNKWCSHWGFCLNMKEFVNYEANWLMINMNIARSMKSKNAQISNNLVL